ncbi:hypothetical protein [uncultured Ferrimonas sp.]|uniref:hypothetical protein n=1 Tax=uncultured Ferrimonas sp. TaxID=432640 RepID=UPI00260403AA|nr:hypothetical protein [uncultured Ferrimonas sp.]
MIKYIFVAAASLISFNAFSDSLTPYYLQLKDRLDRPSDGYCVDVAGNGEYVRFDVPLTAHNCKGPQPYADETIEYRKDNTIYFPSYNGCVTVMGINDKALSGNALMLKGCGIEEPFLNAKNFQKFEFNSKGQVQLEGSHLCMAAGPESHTTYTQMHKWRSLLMLPCSEVELSRSVWEVVPAGYK